MATHGGNSHSGAPRVGKKPPPALGQGGFGCCSGRWGWMQLPAGTARGRPVGFLPSARRFGCSNNPSFSPRRISPEVQQSSFYGYTGLLPKRYTQGVMTGESKYLCPCLTAWASSGWGAFRHLHLGPSESHPGPCCPQHSPAGLSADLRYPKGLPSKLGCSVVSKSLCKTRCAAMPSWGWRLCQPGASFINPKSTTGSSSTPGGITSTWWGADGGP